MNYETFVTVMTSHVHFVSNNSIDTRKNYLYLECCTMQCFIMMIRKVGCRTYG